MAVVGYHTQSKGSVKTTQVVVVSVESKADAFQLELFSKNIWEAEMMKVIRAFKDFYPSDVSLLCTYLPPHDNCVGPFYKALVDQKKIRRTGLYRRSTRSLRKGGVEFQYHNVGV